MNLICVLGLVGVFLAAGQTAPLSSGTGLDQAFKHIYNYDFAAAHEILDAEIQANPGDPLAHAVRGAALLFEEFDRLQILELEFFASDDKVTDTTRVRPDPAVRKRLFEVTGEARRLAQVRLDVDPNDANALFAMCTAVGTETDYVGLIEKKYLRTYRLSRESQEYARRLLAMDPPFYDAYVTTGVVEYVVGNLNFLLRLFIRFDHIEGSTQKAVEDLKKAAEGGRYFAPFAKTLLAAIYLREDQTQAALDLMSELEREFPDNPLVKREMKRAVEKLDRAGTESRGRL